MLKKFYMCFVLSLLLVSNTYAFSDVPTEHPYYNEIVSCYENGYTSGVENDLFGVDHKITIWQFATIAKKAFFHEESNNLVESVQFFCEKGIFQTNLLKLANSPVTRKFAFETLFKLSGVEIFSDELYPDENNHFIQTAVKNNVWPSMANDDLNENITRGEAVFLIDRFSKVSPDCFQQNIPEVMKNLSIKSKQGYLLSPYLLNFKKIPQNIRQLFISEGWSIEIDSELMSKYEQEYQTKISGLCCYADKKICLRNEKSVIHEIGHFYANLLKIETLHPELFSEAEALSELTGDYCKTNESEFFAEFFEYYVNNLNNKDNLNVLKEKTPNTFSVYQSYEISGFSTKGYQ